MAELGWRWWWCLLVLSWRDLFWVLLPTMRSRRAIWSPKTVVRLVHFVYIAKVPPLFPFCRSPSPSPSLLEQERPYFRPLIPDTSYSGPALTRSAALRLILEPDLLSSTQGRCLCTTASLPLKDTRTGNIVFLGTPTTAQACRET